VPPDVVSCAQAVPGKSPAHNTKGSGSAMAPFKQAFMTPVSFPDAHVAMTHAS
jgi:hypothetical protein